MFKSKTKVRRNRLVSRRTRAKRQHIGARRLAVESLESREMLSAAPMTFQVVDDAATNIAYRYSANGAAQGSSTLVAANSAPRGVTSAIASDKTWVIDANRNVYVYNTSGVLLGSWSAGSMANNATPEGIATDGIDIWIVDSRSDKVFRYAGAASRLSGSQAAASNFSLNSSNTNPKDAVTDGYSLWVVDDGPKTDRVFKYNLASASAVGGWTIDAANKAPTGIALDPANVGDLWIADSGSDRVYRYVGATSFEGSNGHSAASSFALASGNGNAQGLVIPGRPWAETPYQVEWIRQFGTAADDWGRGVSADAFGNIYVSGVVNGTAVSSPQFGTPYLAQFDTAGNLNWRQDAVGQTNHEGVRVATDTLGNVFQVVAVFDGSSWFLNNFDSTGALRWTTYLPAGEATFTVATDDLGYAYLSSYEGSNVHVRKFDGATGFVLWERVLDTGGTTNSSGISADHMGNIYVAAYTSGSLLGSNAGGFDAVLVKLTDAGNVLWSRQFGTPQTDYGFIVSTDGLGNAYISGQTTGSLGGPNAGDQDNFLAKFDANGNQLWSRQFGTSGSDTSSSSWIDPAGNVYRAMMTTGALAGPHYGGNDIAVVKYDPTGNILWATQLGTSSGDGTAGGIWGDAQGNLYIAGSTRGSLDGSNAGGVDAILIKLTPPVAAASVSMSTALDTTFASAFASDSLASSTMVFAGTSATFKKSTLPGAVTASAVTTSGTDLLLANVSTPKKRDAAVDSAFSSLSLDNSNNWNASLDEELLLTLAVA